MSDAIEPRQVDTAALLGVDALAYVLGSGAHGGQFALRTPLPSPSSRWPAAFAAPAWRRGTRSV